MEGVFKGHHVTFMTNILPRYNNIYGEDFSLAPNGSGFMTQIVFWYFDWVDDLIVNTSKRLHICMTDYSLILSIKTCILVSTLSPLWDLFGPFGFQECPCIEKTDFSLV